MPAYPIDEPEGLLKEVDGTFVRALRRNLTAVDIFPENQVDGLKVKEFAWQTIEDLDNHVQVTMDPPELSESDRAVVTEQSIKIPFWKRDAFFGGRAWLAQQETELNPEEIARENGRIFAETLNDYLYLGGAVADDTIKGPQESILNHTNRQTFDASTDGNNTWGTPENMVEDLASAATDLVNIPGEDGGFQPPFQLLLHPDDLDLLWNIQTETGQLTQDMIPAQLIEDAFSDRVMADSAIPSAPGTTSNSAYLIKVSPDVYDAVTPFGLGDVRTATKGGDSEDDIALGDGLWRRWFTALAPRVIRPKAVVQIGFDR